jgi:nucleotide-binding universal stress UspA family protein
MPKRILVPVDGSAAGEAVLPLMADAARGGGATVRLLHVVPIPAALETEHGRGLADVDRVMEQAHATGQSYLDGVAASMEGIPVERVVRFGDPAREILVEAEAWGADLVAVTGMPPSPLGRLARRGGVADRVARRARVPVVVYRPGRQRRRARVS